MLSVGTRHERKGLGLGLGLTREMEETELEEGEACYYHDDDESIDPDIALSYIDEKLQDVLGHFQKDFEGGVSAENLGAKFGGYGSFLPTYQRSPSVLSHPRTPQKVQHFSTPKSPNILPQEATRQNSIVPSSNALSMRTASSSSAALLTSRVHSVDNSVKQEVWLSSPRGTLESSPKNEDVSRIIRPTDQKTLKVRIKMGNDNMLAVQKNAAIYSGLGLDISPSSSMEDSPMESAGMYQESREEMEECPTSILQIMTSFPVPDGLLLSPLPDGLLRLMEKERFVRDSRTGTARKGSQESSVMLVDDYGSVRGDGKVFTEKKSASMEKNAGNDTRSLLKKDLCSERPEAKELANALKMSHPFNSKCAVFDTENGTVRSSGVSKAANKDMVNGKTFSYDIAKEEVLETISSEEFCRVDKQVAEASLVVKVREDKKASFHKDISVNPRKNDKHKVEKNHHKRKGEQNYDSFKADFDVSKGKKDLNGGSVNPPKQKYDLKATSDKQDGTEIPNGMDQPLSGAKKKLKGSQRNGISSFELPKESFKVGSSAVLKDKKKNSHANGHLFKSKRDDKKSNKELGKARNSHRDIFEDMKSEQAEGCMDMLETPKDRLKDSMLEVVEKETLTFVDKSRDQSNGKKVDDMPTSEAYPKGLPNSAPPLAGNGPFTDATPAVMPPVVIEDSWVACDRCQKWRLLPFGRNPDDLPKKWMCSMMDWLPGKNRCNTSEEETTRALNALYQAPLPESQNNLQGHPGGAASGVTSAGIRTFDKNNQDLSFHVPGGGKKKHGSKEITDVANHSGHMQLLDPARKNLQASSKSKSLNDVNQSPFESNPVNRSDFHHSKKLGDLALEKHRHKQTEKHGLIEHYLDSGDANHPKLKSKREDDQDGSRASKKIKTQGLYYTDEDVNSDRGGAFGRVDPSSSSGLPTKVTGTDLPKYNEYSSNDSKCGAKRSILISVKKPKDQVQGSLDDGSLDLRRCIRRDNSAKKRKVKGWPDSRDYLETHQSNEHHLQENMVPVKEEISNSESRKGTKARVSKSEGKESSTSKGEGRIDKKGRVMRIHLSGSRNQTVNGMVEGRSVEDDRQLKQYRGNSLQTMDGIDSLKRDLGYVQPSAAANSSSSKVSGSCKTKANFQEVKGSPVESVSSSPLRVSNPNKLTAARRNLLRKDIARNASFSFTGSPRRCSDDEGDGGSDRSGTGRKEKTFSVAHRGSLESTVLDYQDRDANHTSDGKSRKEMEPSPFEFESVHVVNGGFDTLDQRNHYPRERLTKDHCHGEERVNNHFRANGSLPRKSGKGSSRSKDKYRSSISDFERGKVKIPDSFSGQEELFPVTSLKFEAELESKGRASCNGEMRDEKHVIKDKGGIKTGKDEMKYPNKKDSTGRRSSETSKRENQSEFEWHEGSNVKSGTIGSKDGKTNPQKSNREGVKQEPPTTYPGPVPASQKGCGSDVLPVDASGDDASKASKQLRKPDNQHGARDSSLRHHATSNSHGVRDVDAPSPARKDSSSQVAGNTFLKEAKDLKHTADRLKSSGLDLESTELYFQAALKFLHGASLLEPWNGDGSKHGEMTQSMLVYSSTAKLCEFCARDYERRKYMAAAALAYKCMEVAYMRVIYSRRSSASRDRYELQTALQMVPPGESPSSSASDVDNLINQATLDKAALAKGISSPQVTGNHVTKSINSPQVTGNHVIVAGNRPSFVRILDYAQDAYSAMEASMKSQNAFAAANVNLEVGKFGDGISSVKTVLDFSFQDVEGLLRLVRVAMEAISH